MSTNLVGPIGNASQTRVGLLLTKCRGQHYWILSLILLYWNEIEFNLYLIELHFSYSPCSR